MSDWKESAKGFSRLEENFYVIVPSIDYVPSLPLFCPLCSFPIRTAEDREAFDEGQCCETCYLRWVQSRRVEWKEGWRPNEDDFSHYLDEREKNPPKIVVR